MDGERGGGVRGWSCMQVERAMGVRADGRGVERVGVCVDGPQRLG